MTNDAVRGYVVLTLKNLKYTQEEIEKVLDELFMQFDTITEYEAEQYYNSRDWEEKEDESNNR